MAYRIAGQYTAICNCRAICPCPVDGKPTGPGDMCHGAAVFRIDEGSLDDTDLSGVSFGLYNEFPSNLSSGNWKLGIIVDSGASDDQAQAVERILSGQEGGPFGEFAPLVGEYLGMERAAVSLSNGSGSVEGKTDFSFEAYTGPDGKETMVHDAMFGFATDYTIGKGSGSSNAFGISFDASYGESAKFEFSTEHTGEVHPRG